MVGIDNTEILVGTPEWRDVPFMYKRDLRQRSYGSATGSDVLHWFSSSGSTGEPVLYPWSVADEEVAAATVRRIHPTPISSGGVALVIAPTGMPGMWYHMDRQLRGMGLATVFPGVDSVERIFELIERLRPRLLISLPLVLSRLGELRAMRGLVGLPEDGMLFSGGDVLSGARRSRIERFWGAPLKNFYGLSEIFGPLADETGIPNAFAWKAERVFVEVLSPSTKQPVEEGETGVAVITTLWERPASLVRYWTGDCFRLLGWQSPGQPIFEMRGRETVGLPQLKPGLFPVDVDEAVLTDPLAGNEWAVSAEDGGIVCRVETMAAAESDFALRITERLSGMFSAPARALGVPPGTLDRSAPKLAVKSIT